MQATKSIKSYCLIDLYEKFINESKRGKRLQPNGKSLSEGTIQNYISTLRLLKEFSQKKGFPLRIVSIHRLTSRQIEVEKRYWKKFYVKLTSYLYDDLGFFDNYVGFCLKNLKVFLNYLRKETPINIGEFHKVFYVRKEEIAIFPLLPDELNFLIYSETLEATLPKRLKETKDFFVFGCTVGLRVSDLLLLQRKNIRVLGTDQYLAVRSKKTATDTLIKLPDYAVDIINKYKRGKKLLPRFNVTNLNTYIKLLLEKAGFTAQVVLTRERRGRPKELKCKTSNEVARFCDVASTHTMRRTAITTMLSLGMPEQIVRRISGHSPTSKEFFRYVLWAQTYQDKETEKVFQRLKNLQQDRG